MATPEGRVKARIKKILDAGGSRMKYTMPVPFGYGESVVDFMGVYDGIAFVIEAKAPGKSPSPRQEEFIRDWQGAGGVAFVIVGAAPLQLAPLQSFVWDKSLPVPYTYAPRDIL